MKIDRRFATSFSSVALFHVCLLLPTGTARDVEIVAAELGGASFGFNGNDPVMIPFVPEPSAAFLAIFALAAVTCLRRRTLRTWPASRLSLTMARVLRLIPCVILKERRRVKDPPATLGLLVDPSPRVTRFRMTLC